MQRVIALCGNDPTVLQLSLQSALPAGASLSSLKIVKATNKIAKKFVEHAQEITIVSTTTKGLTSLKSAEAKLSNVGEKLFDFVVTGCYWLFAIVTITDIIKKALNHDYMGCFKTAGYGALAYASLQLTRFLMDLIGGLF